MKSSSIAASSLSDFPEFVVTREAFDRYFEKPMPTSTFHDLVNKGSITPFKSMRGRYLLNDSLRRLGLKQVQELPTPPPEPGLEGIVRLAFTLIDPNLFPAPAWLLAVEAINIKDFDHAERIAKQYREEIQPLDHPALKVHYFQGVLDAAFMAEQEG